MTNTMKTRMLPTKKPGERRIVRWKENQRHIGISAVQHAIAHAGGLTLQVIVRQRAQLSPIAISRLGAITDVPDDG
jgi:ABC-type proline/glycine betaine transport system permease subunit